MPKVYRQFQSPVFKYGFALAMVIVSILLRYALMPVLGAGYQYVTVFPLIIVVAILAGRGPAILHSVLAGSLATYFFATAVSIHPYSATVVVILTGVLAGSLAQRLHDALAQTKAQAQALAESEEKFRTLAENANALIGIVQGERFVYVNPYMAEITGYTRQEILDMPIAQIVHPDSRQKVMERAKRRQAGETVESHYEFAVLTKSHEKRLLDFSVTGIRYQGKPAIVGIAFDITDRKNAEDALRESEEKFRMLAENAEAIIGIVQGERIIYANQYSERATGYSRDELLSLDFPKLVHPGYQQAMVDRAQRRQRGEPVESHYEFIMLRKNGQERWLDFSPIMIMYHGKPAIIGIAFDITDRKNAEETLRISEEHFRMASESAAYSGPGIGISITNVLDLGTKMQLLARS